VPSYLAMVGTWITQDPAAAAAAAAAASAAAPAASAALVLAGAPGKNSKCRVVVRATPCATDCAGELEAGGRYRAK
jgi:hypothetical protein